MVRCECSALSPTLPTLPVPWSLQFFYSAEGWGFNLEPSPQMDVSVLSNILEKKLPPYISSLSFFTNRQHHVFRYEGTYEPTKGAATRTSYLTVRLIRGNAFCHMLLKWSCLLVARAQFVH